MSVTVYSDGSCYPNPGPGGFGAVIDWGDREQQIIGGSRQTTNNQMEMLAIIMALEEVLKEGSQKVEVVTDSQYVVYGITRWMPNWRQRGWTGVKNLALWRWLEYLVGAMSVDFSWVRGHNGHAGNEAADELAGKARRMILAGELESFQVPAWPQISLDEVHDEAEEADDTGTP